MKPNRDIRILLDNVRSVHNVGSIFRTAETIGVSKIYCIGTTPAPLDRFGRKRADLAKVALGAEELVAWEYSEKTTVLIKKLKREGFQIIAVEQDKNSVNYKKIKPSNKTLLILGNEVGGVDESLVKISDVIAEIPLRGKKESLNVSVTAGIVLYGLFD